MRKRMWRIGQLRISKNSIAKFALNLIIGTSTLQGSDLFFKLSLPVMIGGETADVVSSYGKPESNPLLGRTFGMRGVGIKAGFVTALILSEKCNKLRTHKKVWAILNYSVGAMSFAVSIKNWRTK